MSTPTPDFESFWDTSPASNRILRADTNQYYNRFIVCVKSRTYPHSLAVERERLNRRAPGLMRVQAWGEAESIYAGIAHD